MPNSRRAEGWRMVDAANEERQMACVDLRGLGRGRVIGPCLSDRDTRAGRGRKRAMRATGDDGGTQKGRARTYGGIHLLRPRRPASYLLWTLHGPHVLLVSLTGATRAVRSFQSTLFFLHNVLHVIQAGRR